MGLFVCNGLAKGEVVWAERKAAGAQVAPFPRSRAWIEALPPASKKAYCHFMYKTGEDEYQSLAEFNETPIEEYPSVRTIDISSYMNHSCSPTCWFVDGGDEFTGLMVAARDLVPGDEITYDYCTSEDCELNASWECRCGSADCRGHITPQDWQRPELQAKYASHFLPHITAKTSEAAAAASPPKPPPPSLQPVDASSSWWVAQLDKSFVMPAAAATAIAGRADRWDLIKHAAVATDLDTLNRQAAMLIIHHSLKVLRNDMVGGFVQSGSPIAKGELVMLLPPNLLLWDDQVPDLNTCLQIGKTSTGDRLFSSSITPADIDNFLCHSCEPNCRFLIGQDLAAGLIASRDIAEGEAINFDYDETEDDLRDLTPSGGVDRGGFECHCGATRCRGEILGKLFSPQYKPEAPR